jgi:hypothetical protein
MVSEMRAFMAQSGDERFVGLQGAGLDDQELEVLAYRGFVCRDLPALRQVDIAKKLGVTRAVVQRLERGGLRKAMTRARAELGVASAPGGRVRGSDGAWVSSTRGTGRHGCLAPGRFTRIARWFRAFGRRQERVACTQAVVRSQQPIRGRTTAS